MRSDRENTGNLKMQIEWVPCYETRHKNLFLPSVSGTRQLNPVYIDEPIRYL